MGVVNELKQKISTIAGSRHLTILQKFIDENYKNPDIAFRGGVGDYSPKETMSHLRLITAYLKGLCANKGKLLVRYYSYGRISEINDALDPMALMFDTITATTGKNALREILFAIPKSLETIKNILGPYIDIKMSDAIIDMTTQIQESQEALQHINDISKIAKKESTSIEKNFHKSEEAQRTFNLLIKETKHLQKQLDLQKDISKQIIERNRVISTDSDKIQKDLEQRYQTIEQEEQQIVQHRKTLEEESSNIQQSITHIAHVMNEVKQYENQANILLSQARHALNMSQGAGLLDGYKELSNRANRNTVRLPWLMGALLGFFSSMILIAMNYFNIKNLSEIREILAYPTMLAQIVLIPFTLLVFFVCLIQYRSKVNIMEKYRSRIAALETYLKLSDHLPYDSPEHVHTTNHILRCIEEDFSPIARSAIKVPQ